MSPAETVSTDGPVLPSDLVGQYTIAQSYELTPRKCMAFAAGVHDYKACYFDDTRPEELVGHPGLAFAFQWNSHYTAGRPYDVRAPMWRHLLHAGSDVRYARPFRIGDQITCQGRTVRLRPIKPGLLWEQRYTMVDASGATVVELDHSAIVRNARLEGPPREIDESPPLPQPAGPVDEPLWTASVPIAPEAPHVYSECADIWNPIHTERAAALAAGLPDIVLHGTATLTIAARELIDREVDGDPRRLSRIAGQYRAMVFPGHPLTVRLLERRRLDNGSTAIFFDALNHEGQAAVKSGVLVSR